MKRILVIILAIGLFKLSNAQNLVVNGDFETYTTCPTNGGQVANATGWSDAFDSPDYLNTGVGCWSGGSIFPGSTPHNGNGFGGFFSQINSVSGPVASSLNSERMYGTLATNMVAGQTYNISFALKYDNLSAEGDSSFSDSLAVGIYLWDSNINGTSPVLNPRTSTATTPQAYAIASNVGSNYQVYTFTHVATANYDSIVIGGFYIGSAYKASSTGFWFGKYFNIDDISINPIYPPSSQCDTICGPNLAPNPGFENTTIDCSDTISEMFTNYSQVQSWFGTACNTCPGNGSTPDYYNSLCNGPSQTNNCGTSNGSVGFFTYAIAGANAREYVQAQMSSPLVAGMEYCVSVDVKTNTGSFVYKPSDGFGLWFTNQMVDIDIQNGGQQFIGPGSLINASPQIENTSGNFIDTICQTITGTFVATGNEQWIVLGNFRDDSNTQFNTSCSFFNPCFGYLIVDNLSIRTSCNNIPQPVTLQLNASNDTICEGDCAALTATINGGTPPFNVSWDNSLPNGVGPHNVCPTTQTTYTAIVTDSLGDKDTSSITIYVNPKDSIATSVTICSNDSVFAGGNWQNSTGIYHDTLNNTFGCDSIYTTVLTVIPKDTAAFTYPSGSYCLTDPDPLPTITGTTGGTFSIDNSGVINSSTGLIDLSASGLGNYVVTYITNGTCPDTATFNIAITNSTDATITQAGPFCENDPSVTLTAVDPGGNWTGTGITNATNGTFDPATAGAGNHVITYTIAGSCGDVDTMTIVVNPADDASFSFSPATFCDTDPNPLPTGIVTTGGTFSIDNGGTINGATGEVNLSASGAGSYVVTYITNGSCPDTVNFNITITTCATPTASYTVSDSTICDGECVTFTDNSTGATAWQWTFNGGTPASANTQGPHTVCFTGPGTYNIELIASNSAGADTTTSTVEVFANPTIDAGSDVTIDLGQSVTLNATGSNGTYSWTPPTWLDCPTCSTTTSTPEETITYTVVVVDSNGCTASDEVTIIVDFDYVIWVPNIFSPNGDGSNDVVFVRGVGVESFNFVIYDRWGEKVFETSDLNNGWDGTFRGKKMNNAVFVYYLEATFNNGQEVTKKGDITLIR